MAPLADAKETFIQRLNSHIWHPDIEHQLTAVHFSSFISPFNRFQLLENYPDVTTSHTFRHCSFPIAVAPLALRSFPISMICISVIVFILLTPQPIACLHAVHNRPVLYSLLLQSTINKWNNLWHRCRTKCLFVWPADSRNYYKGQDLWRSHESCTFKLSFVKFPPTELQVLKVM